MKIGLILAAACLSACFAGCAQDGSRVSDIREYDFNDPKNLIRPLSGNAPTSFETADIIEDIKVVELRMRADAWRIDNKIISGPDGDIFVVNEDEVCRFSAQGEFRYRLGDAVRDTEDYISFVVCGPEAKSYEYIYSKKSGKNICLTAPDGYAFPIWFQTSDEDYFYTVYRRTGMEGIDERACPVSKYLAERLGVVPEDEHPLLVGIKFDFDMLP